ncbi:type II toxin-antitoxin system RelE/ParE family toxin [Cyclonatronum proteinivorum]|uniref:type II toxin-antitoxin system RelE/ParE family toxin n=1 Tax=Cyclonatronum proteinivorum TaxID=1457365 RepID=UPI000E0EA2AE|nr:type II toxin-antitoxin system RelE/ParE family toxin [Cyclonatronum proteinivorum]
MELRLLKPAELELDEGISWYELQVTGLGDEFLNEILITFKRIKSNPKAWPVFTVRTRRCLVHKFPYGVVYQIRKDEILVVAIYHLHRKPFYWKDRI